MNPATFQKTQPILDRIAEIADHQLASSELHQAITKLSEVLGKGRIVSVSLIVDVFDEGKECSLPLLNTGLSTSPGKAPYRIWGDSSPQRYVIDAGIQVVPHDRCPKCWEEWDFKLQHPTCPHCGTTLGADCKVLLDTDVCPWCEDGKVGMANPQCDKCGFVVDPMFAVRG